MNTSLPLFIVFGPACASDHIVDCPVRTVEMKQPKQNAPAVTGCDRNKTVLF